VELQSAFEIANDPSAYLQIVNDAKNSSGESSGKGHSGGAVYFMFQQLLNTPGLGPDYDCTGLCHLFDAGAE
jgi:hypothetical protein